MKAVNLIPRDTRAAGGGATGGTAPYVVLGVLALVVAMSALYTLTSRSLTAKRAESAQVTAQATATEAQAAKLKHYTEFATLRKARVETVKNLAEGRFDWATSLHELARTLPKGAWVTSVRASVSPNASVDGSSDPLRTALAAPALEIVGCAPDQDAVAEVVASLRRTSGAQRVTLSSSKKAETSGGGGDSANDTTGCGRKPQFSLTVFYAAKATAATAASGSAAAATTPATGSTGADTTAASGSTGAATTPASGSTGATTTPATGSTGGATGATTP